MRDALVYSLLIIMVIGFYANMKENIIMLSVFGVFLPIWTFIVALTVYNPNPYILLTIIAVSLVSFGYILVIKRELKVFVPLLNNNAKYNAAYN